MAKLHHLLFGSALLASMQLAHAQSALEVPTQAAPQQPAATEPTPATAIEPATDGAATMPAETSGDSTTGASTAAEETSGGMVIGTIIETSPPTRAVSAAELSNDPLVQRREARAQARREYRARVQAAPE